MILAIQSVYSQYPTTKRIKGDSVVIMRIGQADTINLLYKSYNDTISSLRDSLGKKIDYTQVLVSQVVEKKDSIKMYQWRVNSQVATEDIVAEIKRSKQVVAFTVFLMFMVSIGVLANSQYK